MIRNAPCILFIVFCSYETERWIVCHDLLEFVVCRSLIDRRGLVVADDSEHSSRVRPPTATNVAAATPAAAATTATAAAAVPVVDNKVFANSTVADVNPSVENRLVSSDNKVANVSCLFRTVCV